LNERTIMSHSPPIPPANQAPFPTHEKPHEPASVAAAPVSLPEPRSADRALDAPYLGLAVGLGLAVLAGVGWWLRTGSKTAAPVAKRRRAGRPSKHAAKQAAPSVPRRPVRRRASAAPTAKTISATE
jgi:hypothetical protein